MLTVPGTSAASSSTTMSPRSVTNRAEYVAAGSMHSCGAAANDVTGSATSSGGHSPVP